MSSELRNFLALSYHELEGMNLKAKEQRKTARRRAPEVGRFPQLRLPRPQPAVW